MAPSQTPSLATDQVDNAAWVQAYHEYRRKLLGDPEVIIRFEQMAHSLLTDALVATGDEIARGFEFASQTLPHWIAAACPADRGKAPTGTAIHWAEVAQHTVLDNVLPYMTSQGKGCWHPGLPACSDGLLAGPGWLLQVDAKATGPTEGKHDLVVSTNQLSGDGQLKSVARIGGSPVAENSSLFFHGRQSKKLIEYQPLLAPFYLPDPSEQALICVTSFIKVVYAVESRGQQPLIYLDVATFPNGLLTAAGSLYDVDALKLFKAGKDDSTIAPYKRRVRVDLKALTNLASWRTSRLSRDQEGWDRENRPL